MTSLGLKVAPTVVLAGQSKGRYCTRAASILFLSLFLPCIKHTKRLYKRPKLLSWKVLISVDGAFSTLIARKSKHILVNGRNSKQISQRAPLSYKSHLWLTGWQLWTCSSGQRTRRIILRDTNNKNISVTEKLTFCISRQICLFCAETVISVFRMFTHQFLLQCFDYTYVNWRFIFTEEKLCV